MTFLEQILLTIVTASATAILAYFGFWRQAKAELQKEYESRFNEKKWEVYVSIMNLWSIRYQIDRIKEKQQRKKIEPFKPKDVEGIEAEYFETDEFYETQLKEFNDSFHEIEGKIESQVLLMGSEKVIKSYWMWERTTLHTGVRNEKNVQNLIMLINAMREDLGQKKSNIDFKELDGLFYVSDEKFRERMKQMGYTVIESQNQEKITLIKQG